MKKRKTGFTLVELLVVIAIIALLMGILMPALAKVRHIAYRMVCGSNCGGIGKAIMVYSQDNHESFPQAGGRFCQWTSTGSIADFQSNDPALAFSGCQATISSCLYLLVKYADMPPKQFNCKGDVGVKEMKLNEFNIAQTGTVKKSFADLFDFSDKNQTSSDTFPGDFCSYSYHDPFQNSACTQDVKDVARPASATSAPDFALLADRNPMIDRNAWQGGSNGYWANMDSKANYAPKWDKSDTTKPAGFLNDPDKCLNAASHQRDGQNVLFNDSHVSFELSPNCGVDKDNVWLPWPAGSDVTAPDDEKIQYGDGTFTYKPGSYGPRSDRDSWLINERNGSSQF